MDLIFGLFEFLTSSNPHSSRFTRWVKDALFISVFFLAAGVVLFLITGALFFGPWDPLSDLGRPTFIAAFYIFMALVILALLLLILEKVVLIFRTLFTKNKD